MQLQRFALPLLFAVFAASVMAHDDDNGGGSGGGGASGPPYPTSNMLYLGSLSIAALSNGASGVAGNSCWGWTDPQTGREYALMGLTNGLAFVDVTVPTAPVHLGNLPSHTGNSTWRDVRVFADRAYVVADNNGNHGMQVFDLNRLRGVTTERTWSEDNWYGGFGRAHTININEQTGFAYVNGSDTYSGGLHVVDVRPDSPTYLQNVGGFAADGYTHEATVVTYHGPDSRFVGHEIAFGANEDTVTIVDGENKAAMTQLSRTGYPLSGYTHQGSLTEDQRYFIFDDELDELNTPGSTRTRTHVMRIDDLMNPVYLGYWESPVSAIDHNLFIKGNLIYESNYTAGLRVIRMNDIDTLDFEEVGYIDTRPGDDAEAFRGAWDNYPYFASGTILISDINEGLVLARYTPVPEPASLAVLGVGALALLRRRRK